MEKPYSRIRYVVAGWAVLESMLFGGIVNGWASMIFVLKKDGLYADLCDSSQDMSDNSTDRMDDWTLCTAQDGRLNLWYSIAAALQSIFCITIGIHMFKLGIRSARLTGWIMFISGTLMMAFVNNEIPWLLLPALVTLSYGGVTLMLTNFQVSCLFPGATGIIVNLISGAFDFSAAMQMVLKLLHDSNMFSRQDFFITLAVAHFIIVLISTTFFLPGEIPCQQCITFDSDMAEQSPESPQKKQRNCLHGCICHCFPHSEKSSNETEQRQMPLVNQAMTVEPDLKEYSSSQDVKKQQMCTCELMPVASAPDLVNTNAGFEHETCAVKKCPSNGPTDASSSHIFRNNEYLGIPADQICTDLHAQGGLQCLNNIKNVPTISGTLHENNHRNVEASDARGKCVSVIDIGQTPNTRALQCETNEPIKTPADVDCQEAGNTLSDDFKLGGSPPNHHGVRQDVCPGHELTVEPTAGTGSNVDEVRNDDKEEEELFPTLKACFTSTIYWLHVMWHSFALLWLIAFFGLINPKLNITFRGDTDKVSYYTNVQAFFMLGIMGVCWISGALYDWQVAMCKARKTAFQRRVLPGVLPLVATSLVGVALSAMWIINTDVSFYIMCALMVVYNASVFGVCASFLLIVFPRRYYGILNGVVYFTAGCFCLLEYALKVWYDSYPDGALHADVFLLSLVVLSLCHPLYIVCKAFWPSGQSQATLDNRVT